MRWRRITVRRYEAELLDSQVVLYKDYNSWILKLDIDGLHIRGSIQEDIEIAKQKAIEIIKERLEYYKNNITEYIEELNE